MSTAPTNVPAANSELVELRPSVRASALASIGFLAQHVLGLPIEPERCAALQSGAFPRTAAERRAVIVYGALRRGVEPEGLSPVERYLLIA